MIRALQSHMTQKACGKSQNAMGLVELPVTDRVIIVQIIYIFKVLHENSISLSLMYSSRYTYPMSVLQMFSVYIRIVTKTCALGLPGSTGICFGLAKLSVTGATGPALFESYIEHKWCHI